jgi:DNA-binding NarL/FixJ family response regulator
MNVIRVLIADDHPVFRFGLRALLNAMPDTEVVGEVTTGEDALALADSVRPDVILMDINTGQAEIRTKIGNKRFRVESGIATSAN